MRLSRRRFLVVTASAMVLGGAGGPAPLFWRGRALGAEAEIRIDAANEGQARLALRAARDTLRRVEKLFSLYDADSALSRLNVHGELEMPPEFSRLVHSVDVIHRASGGLFDPSVQPLLSTRARTGASLRVAELDELRLLLGWKKVVHDQTHIRFSVPGMALTFNGIAQGFATDRVADVLNAHGFEQTLVNVGEFRAGKAPMRIGLADETGAILEARSLRSGALATSSPHGLLFSDGASHIQRPDARNVRPGWRTVTVEAETATVADALSTALVLTPDTSLARSLKARGLVRSVLFQKISGEVLRI